MSYNGAVLTKDTNSIEQSSSQQLTSQLSARALFISLLTRIITRQRKGRNNPKKILIGRFYLTTLQCGGTRNGPYFVSKFSSDTDDGHLTYSFLTRAAACHSLLHIFVNCNNEPTKYSQVFTRNQNSWLKFPSLKVYEVIFYASLQIILSEFDCLSALSRQNRARAPRRFCLFLRLNSAG